MAKGLPNVPKFLSTHPENQDRQERLQRHMDEVQNALYVFHRRLLRKVSKLVVVATGILRGDSVMECGRDSIEYIRTLHAVKCDHSQANELSGIDLAKLQIMSS